MKLRYRREKILAQAERIDFLVSRVGIEVKTQGGVVEVMRQLLRYAKSPDVDALILVTTRVALSDMPDELEGKPLHVAVLFGAIL